MVQKLMNLTLNQEKDKYFMHLTSQGVKLPPNFGVEGLIQKEEPFPYSILNKEIEKMWKESIQLRNK